MESLKEIEQFLSVSARLDLKAVAIANILELTGSSDGRALLLKCDEILVSIIRLTQDESGAIAKDAALCLVNLSADQNSAEILLKISTNNDENNGAIRIALKNILDPESSTADIWCMLLCNLTRPNNLVEQFINELLKLDNQIEKLVACFTRVEYNKKKQSLNYLGPLFSNLSQHARGRELICNKSRRLLQRLLPFTHHYASVIRRGGAIGLVKNICFDSSIHEWLLSEDVEILPYILLPLAGPEEFDLEDNDKFPPELQFLGSDKTREEDPDLRKMLLESLSQLCATKSAREYLRSKGTYEILREYHKWELKTGKDKLALIACENVVDVLIRTEDEIGHDNLKEVEIPNDMLDKIKNLSDDVDSVEISTSTYA